MKKIFIIFAVFILFTITAFAQQPDMNSIDYQSEYPNFYYIKTNDDMRYLTDKNYNILVGPCELIESGSSGEWFICEMHDGSEVLYDADLNELASVPPAGEIFHPENGIYGVSKTNMNATKIRDFQLFDFETNELLSEPGYFVPYYLEKQSEKMTIKKDGKYAIINKYGEYLTDFVFDEIKQRFDYRFMFPQPYMIVVIDGEEKYLDWDLNYIDLDNYNDGHFVTERFEMNTRYNRETNLWWLVSGEKNAMYNSATGKLIISFEAGYDFRYQMTDGTTFTAKNSEGLYGLFDNDGNMLLNFEYSGIGHTPVPEIVSLYKEHNSLGYYNLVRKEYIPEFVGEVADEGLVIYTKYERRQIPGAPVVGDKYTENVPVSSQILNFAGHDVGGKEYKYITCENSVFMEDTDGDRTGDTPVSVKRDFAIIRLNGKYLDFDGVIADDRTLVPVREITEGFGGNVLWNETTNTATLCIDDKEIVIEIEKQEMFVDGESILLDVPAKLINNKTMIPLRKLAEILGAQVEWDEALKCVHISR